MFYFVSLLGIINAEYISSFSAICKRPSLQACCAFDLFYEFSAFFYI